jgi:hypothetical protein
MKFIFQCRINEKIMNFTKKSEIIKNGLKDFCDSVSALITMEMLLQW